MKSERGDAAVIEAADFLALNFSRFATDVRAIGTGMFAQAFSFEADGEHYVLRVSRHGEDFLKDAFAHSRFSPGVPVPRMAAIGRFDGERHFAVSERCPGTTMNLLPAEELERCSESLFKALDRIHADDAKDLAGWGLTDEHGRGRFLSWEEYVLSFYNQKLNVTWQHAACESFLDAKLYTAFLEEMRRLLPYASQKKAIVHGDYGFDNVTVRDGTVTGVLDWAEMLLGDPLYDVAWLDYWCEKLRIGDMWLEWAKRKGKAVERFEERMRCYMLHTGLSDLVIAAMKGDRREYEWTHRRLRATLLDGRREPCGP